jgi:hypothetical protein
MSEQKGRIDSTILNDDHKATTTATRLGPVRKPMAYLERQTVQARHLGLLANSFIIAAYASYKGPPIPP